MVYYHNWNSLGFGFVEDVYLFQFTSYFKTRPLRILPLVKVCKKYTNAFFVEVRDVPIKFNTSTIPQGKQDHDLTRNGAS